MEKTHVAGFFITNTTAQCCNCSTALMVLQKLFFFFLKRSTSETCCFDFLYVYFATMFLTKILFFSDMVGWYSTGPELRDNDLDVHAQFCHYAPYPVLVVINVGLGIPTNSYYTMSSLEVTHILFLTIYILYIFNHLDCILLLFRKSRKKSLFVRL